MKIYEHKNNKRLLFNKYYQNYNLKYKLIVFI